FFQVGFVADGSLAPGFVVIGLEADVKLAIEESRRVGAVVGAAELRADYGDHRILIEDVANLGRELRGVFKGDRVWHGGANPQRTFVEVRQEFAADVGNEEKSRRED